MWSYLIMNVNLYYVIQWFLIYSFLGWCVESLYMSFCNRKLTNRGFVKGPMCPIYGFGALLAFFALGSLVGHSISLFLAGSILATTLEFLTAQLMLVIFGEFWWDYREKPFNYKGILCLESSIAWGFYTLGFFYFLHNQVIRFVEGYTIEFGIYLAKCILTLYFVDFVCRLCEIKEHKPSQENHPGRLRQLRQSIRMIF